MFRRMRRHKQQLDEDVCKELLANERRGALGMHGEGGYPYVIPVNYLFDDSAGSPVIYFHSAVTGHKVDALSADPKVCFTIWNKGDKDEADGRFYYVDSVICFGRASVVESRQELLDSARRFAMKYYENEEDVQVEMDKDLGRMILYRIDVEHMTSKHVHEQ